MTSGGDIINTVKYRLNISNNHKSNQLSLRNRQLFPLNPYSPFPLFRRGLLIKVLQTQAV